jgi:hypothetical protein
LCEAGIIGYGIGLAAADGVDGAIEELKCESKRPDDGEWTSQELQILMSWTASGLMLAGTLSSTSFCITGFVTGVGMVSCGIAMLGSKGWRRKQVAKSLMQMKWEDMDDEALNAIIQRYGLTLPDIARYLQSVRDRERAARLCRKFLQNSP